MNGAAAHWLILARSSGSESELSAIRFSTYSFAKGRLRVDFRILGTLPRGEQIAVETDRPQVESRGIEPRSGDRTLGLLRA